MTEQQNTTGPARDNRALTHIKAVMEALKDSTDGQASAAPAGLFISGMLTGLAAAVQIYDGGTAEQAMEQVNTRLAAAIGEAYLAGHLPPHTQADSEADRQRSSEEEIRGVQGWMALDLHQALGLKVDDRAEHQGHRSWANWWADLCGRVRQRTYAELAHARAFADPDDITATSAFSLIALTKGLEPQPDDLFFPTAYGATLAEAHPATPNDPPYMIDLIGYSDGDPLRQVARRLIVHRSLVAGLVRDLAKLGDPQAQPDPAGQLAKVDAILRDYGIEYPLGARGVKDLASQARLYLEDLRRTEEERDGAYRERARLVAFLAAQYDAHIGYTDPNATDWLVVTIETPTGQTSWHIAERDRDLFEHVRLVPSTHNVWDGHTTDEKYIRLAALTTQLAEGCGPACAEMHTETGRCEIGRTR